MALVEFVGATGTVAVALVKLGFGSEGALRVKEYAAAFASEQQHCSHVRVWQAAQFLAS